MRKKLGGKLKALKRELARRMHQPIEEVGGWLRSVLRGHYAYYAVPGNSQALWVIRDQLTRMWHQRLRRRSQNTRLSWARMGRIARQWLPYPRILHLYPEQRLCVTT